jgi:hypothetical protein
MQLVVKYPNTCIEATLNQTYYWFSPLAENQFYYTGMSTYAKYPSFDFLDLCPENTSYEMTLREYHYAIGRMPVVSLLVNTGFYTILLVATYLYALVRKKGKIFVLGIPLLLTLAVAIVGPASIRRARYTFPLIYSMALYIGIYIYRSSESEQ